MDERQQRAAKRRTAFAAISRRLKEFYETLMVRAFKDAEVYLVRAQRQTGQKEHDR
jgi:hypothetical protein